MQKFRFSPDKEHSAEGSQYEKNSTDYHQPSPDKKVCTKWLMNHGHGAENKVNLLVREHGVISKCCSLRNETNGDKLTNWQIERFSLSFRSWFNTFNMNPNYQKLKEYYLTRLTIITPDAIIPILIFFLCSLELNNKKLHVIHNKNMTHHLILTYLSYMIHVVFYLRTNCCLNFDLRSDAMLFASITKQTIWKKICIGEINDR